MSVLLQRAVVERALSPAAIARPMLQRWQGTPQQTRDALLAWVWANIGQWQQADEQTVEDAVYDRATKGAGAAFTQRPNDQQHVAALNARRATTSAGTQVDRFDEDSWRFYEAANRQAPYPQGQRISRRVSVHVNPDDIYTVIDHLNEHLLDRPYVSSYKVSRRPESVESRLDNIDIYFDDDRQTQTDHGQDIWTQILAPIQNRLLAEHPAMMTQLHPGVGTADDPGGGESFSGLRSKAIAAAVVAHHNGMITCANVDELRWQVTNRLRFRGVSTADPSRHT